jgi:LuxR family maltose regulon positive regulatory protein
LRFTVEEATAFLTHVMQLPLSTTDVQALEQRTEGWIAGLQFAALAMRDRADLHGFVNAFAGSHHFVLDYLVDEVLLRQPSHLQTFLLRTAILDRMCSSLCDAILLGDTPSASDERGYSQAISEELEHANLFVVPLDDMRQWYRYHHLFADVLRHRLESGASPDEIRLLHARAAAWYEQHGYVDEAIRHALAGRAFSTAARVIEQQALLRLARGELATLQHWLVQLPENLIRERPFLGRALVFVLLLSGRFGAIEAHLMTIEQGIVGARIQVDPARLERDDAAVRVLAGEVAAIRALFANLREQTDSARELCRQASAVLPHDHILIGFAHYTQGVTAWLEDDVTTAGQILQQAQQECQAVSNVYFLQVTMAYLAQVRALQSHLRDAIGIYQHALVYTPTIEGRPHAEGNGLYVGLGALHYERNELAAAERDLTTGIELARQEGNALVLSGGLLVLARLRLAQGETDAARALLTEATNLLTQHRITWLWVCGSAAAYQLGLTIIGG